jgi:hypothetical protein
MNEDEESDQEAYLTVEWEYLPASAAQGFDIAKMVWLDVAGTCSSADVKITGKGDVFNLTAAWNATFSSRILTIMSHVHDGGIHQVLQIGNKTVCDSAAKYGESARFRSPADEGATAATHISSMGACNNVGTFAKGDQLKLTAVYDTIARAPMLSHDGTRHPVMGIAITYAARPWDEAMSEILADKGPEDRNIIIEDPSDMSGGHHHHRRA